CAVQIADNHEPPAPASSHLHRASVASVQWSLASLWDVRREPSASQACRLVRRSDDAHAVIDESP
ncbi:MAG TPA: hypothetical protein VFQ35_21410, partial [Polyangiaceae bacterium]|nr:hypothetical protein [Polyangiaceae bacterium]